MKLSAGSAARFGFGHPDFVGASRCPRLPPRGPLDSRGSRRARKDAETVSTTTLVVRRYRDDIFYRPTAHSKGKIVFSVTFWLTFISIFPSFDVARFSTYGRMPWPPSDVRLLFFQSLSTLLDPSTTASSFHVQPMCLTRPSAFSKTCTTGDKSHEHHEAVGSTVYGGTVVRSCSFSTAHMAACKRDRRELG